MIEKISLGLISESGETIEMLKASNAQIESKIETAIADTFSAICFGNNSIADEEIKLAEKFNFALNLKNYLKEMKENVSQ